MEEDKRVRKGKLIVIWGRKAEGPVNRLAKLPKIKVISPGCEFDSGFFLKKTKSATQKGAEMNRMPRIEAQRRAESPFRTVHALLIQRIGNSHGTIM